MSPVPDGRHGLADGAGMSVWWDGPLRGRRVILAHGAGGSATSEVLAGYASALGARRMRVARFNFPYADQGRRAPDRAAVLLASWRAALRQLGGRSPVVGGKSMGGRYATLLLAEDDAPRVSACVLLGYPLHPAGRIESLRVEHLARVQVPMLFLAGTRDPLARLDLLERAVSELPAARLHVVDGANHDFAVGRRPRHDVLEELAAATAEFVAAAESRPALA